MANNDIKLYSPCGPVVRFLQTCATRSDMGRRVWQYIDRKITASDEFDLTDDDLEGSELWVYMSTKLKDDLTNMMRAVSQAHELMNTAQPPDANAKNRVLEQWLMDVRKVKKPLVDFCDTFMRSTEYQVCMYCSAAQNTDGRHMNQSPKIARNISLLVRPFVFVGGIYMHQDLRGNADFLQHAQKYFECAAQLLEDLTDICDGAEKDQNNVGLLLKDVWTTFGSLARIHVQAGNRVRALYCYRIFFAADLIIKGARITGAVQEHDDGTETKASTPQLTLALASRIAKQQEPSDEDMASCLPGHSLDRRSVWHTETWMAVAMMVVMLMLVFFHYFLRDPAKKVPRPFWPPPKDDKGL